MKSAKYLLVFLIASLSQALLGQASSPMQIQPSIQVVQNLFFGGLLVNPEGGRITLTADGALIPVGPGVQPGAQPPSHEARFHLTGPPKASFSLKVDPQFPMLNSPAGGPVRIAEFHPSFPAFQGVFDATGQAEFRLGGTLDIASGTVPALFMASQVKLQLNVMGGSGLATVNSPFSISALLRAPLCLTNLGPLDFGALIPGSSSGDFEVLPNGSHRSLGANGPTHIKSAPRPAAFTLQGPAGTCFNIRLPKQVLLSGPGSRMSVHDFTCDAPAHGALPPGGLQFNVGGRITVDPSQAYGRYSGTFTVEVFYQ